MKISPGLWREVRPSPSQLPHLVHLHIVKNQSLRVRLSKSCSARNDTYYQDELSHFPNSGLNDTLGVANLEIRQYL